jgi:menaquinone-dependent protoporphyrinogen oxidase
VKVLIAVASRHGSTKEIADAMAAVLAASRFEVDVMDPDDVDDLSGYGGVILGSSVYVGRWAASARAMVDRHAAALTTIPLWLFSSGPLGNPPVPTGDPEEVVALATRLHAAEHHMFAGRLDRADLLLAERAVVSLVRAQYGDFRDWTEIEQWAASVAAELHAEEIRTVHLVR